MRDIRREELLEKLLTLRPELEQRGVARLALFGSRARRDNRPDSDIDLLVDIDESRKFSLLDLVGVQLSIEDLLGLPTNMFMRRSLDKEFQEVASSEQIKIS